MTELPGLRTFDWYPHTQSLVAAGLSTGKVLLVRLAGGSSSQSSIRDVVQINGTLEVLLLLSALEIVLIAGGD